MAGFLYPWASLFMATKNRIKPTNDIGPVMKLTAERLSATPDIGEKTANKVSKENTEVKAVRRVPTPARLLSEEVDIVSPHYH
jgi:hypothetical protein